MSSVWKSHSSNSRVPEFSLNMLYSDMNLSTGSRREATMQFGAVAFAHRLSMWYVLICVWLYSAVSLGMMTSARVAP